MSTSETSRVDTVGEVYDEMAEAIELLGGNIHVGYWLDDDDRTPLLEAVNRCTDIVGEKLGLRPGQRLLDVGCGAAVPAIRLGQRHDVMITGVTNSGWQVTEARRRVKAAGLRGQVEVDHGDAAALAYPDCGFDAVLALQVLQHADDQGEWLREMARVVRPGGRVVLTAYIEEIPLTEAEGNALRAGAMHPPLPARDVLAAVRDSGLVIDEVADCGDRVRPSYDAFLDRLIRRRADVVDTIGEEFYRLQEEAMARHMPIYREKIGYLIITAHRPG